MSKAQEHWQRSADWIVKAYTGKFAPPIQRKEAAEDGSYLGRADTTGYKALVMLALEHPLGEELLELVVEFLEEAEKRDDCWFYGKWGEVISEEEILGQTFTNISYGVPEDGSEPFHDEELGRALRARYLFVFRWIESGERDLEILNLGIERMRSWIDLQFNLPKGSPEKKRNFDGPTVHFHRLMLWALEGERYDMALDYYRKYVKPEYQLSLPPVEWWKIADQEHLYYLMAAHASGAADLSSFLTELTEAHYRRRIADVIEGEWNNHLDNSLLGLAYLRAKMAGAPTNPRQLLVGIRQESYEEWPRLDL